MPFADSCAKNPRVSIARECAAADRERLRDALNGARCLLDLTSLTCRRMSSSSDAARVTVDASACSLVVADAVDPTAETIPTTSSTNHVRERSIGYFIVQALRGVRPPFWGYVTRVWQRQVPDPSDRYDLSATVYGALGTGTYGASPRV